MGSAFHQHGGKNVSGLALAKHATRDSLRLEKLVAVVLMHLGAVAAPFFFTWAGLGLFAVLAVLTGQLGLVIGFHRLLAHRSFRTFKPVEYALAMLGTLALETGPITWVGIHRYHHKHADEDIDPHTPLVSLFWAHIVWAVFEHPELRDRELRRRFGGDAHGHAVHQALERYIYPINALFAVFLLGLGVVLGGLALGLSFLFWGVFARTVYIWHVTFLVASVCHKWGYRSYRTRDNSRNVWWVSVIGFGEGWHNNHHAKPLSANYGHRWYELDVSYWIILAMEAVGLAWAVRRPSEERARELPASGVGSDPGSVTTPR